MLPKVGRPGRKVFWCVSLPVVAWIFGIDIVIDDTFVMSSDRSTLKLFTKMCLSASVFAILRVLPLPLGRICLGEREIVERSRPRRAARPRATQVVVTPPHP